MANTIRRRPKLPTSKTSQVSANSAIGSGSEHCFLDSTNQALEMVGDSGKEFGPHL